MKGWIMLYDIAVGGTAPRKEDSGLYTTEVWNKLIDHFHKEVVKMNVNSAQSGGQAGPDLFPVHEYLKGNIQTLRLDIPGYFNLETKLFETDKEHKALRWNVDLTNDCYTQLQKTSGVDAFDMLARCHEHRPGQSFSIYSHYSFWDRNNMVKLARVFWAYTTNLGEEPDDGGTMYTWNQHKFSGVGYQRHFSIPTIVGGE
jgi:hypothetical protein